MNLDFFSKNRALTTREIFKVLGIILAIGIFLSIFVGIIGMNSEKKSGTLSSMTSVSISKIDPNLSDRYQSKYVVENFTMDGYSYILSLQNKYDDIGVWLDGKIMTMGTYSGSRSCGKNGGSYNEVCYNFSGKTLTFRDTPRENSVVKVKGFPQN